MSKQPPSPNPTRSLFDIVRDWVVPRWQRGLQRYASHMVLIFVALATIWVTQNGGQRMTEISDQISAGFLQPSPTPEQIAVMIEASQILGESESNVNPLTRSVSMNTDIPTRPRTEITEYEVQSGDTIIGIADRFGISPQTVMWGNRHILNDDPHSLRPGQKLLISPVNGVLRQVYEGDSLELYATWFNSDVDTILFWPGNDLDPDNPELEIGKWIIVPGGSREFVQLIVPNPNVQTIAAAGVAGRTLWPAGAGPGACAGGYTGGATGVGSFVWPTNLRTISGTNYTSFHPALDIAAGIGDAIYASDSGIVIFAGWSNWGYGNMVVINHRNGWQTLYAHLSSWNVSCGQSVFQGNIVGLAGSTGNSTGPHLHFEMNLNGARLNPWNFLP